MGKIINLTNISFLSFNNNRYDISSDKRVFAIISSVDCIKNDSEIKFLYACTDDEIQVIYKEHNRSDSMKGILTRRYDCLPSGD